MAIVSSFPPFYICLFLWGFFGGFFLLVLNSLSNWFTSIFRDSHGWTRSFSWYLDNLCYFCLHILKNQLFFSTRGISDSVSLLPIILQFIHHHTHRHFDGVLENFHWITYLINSDFDPRWFPHPSDVFHSEVTLRKTPSTRISGNSPTDGIESISCPVSKIF